MGSADFPWTGELGQIDEPARLAAPQAFGEPDRAPVAALGGDFRSRALPRTNEERAFWLGKAATRI
jgi:hypothetical protein